MEARLLSAESEAVSLPFDRTAAETRAGRRAIVSVREGRAAARNSAGRGAFNWILFTSLAVAIVFLVHSLNHRPARKRVTPAAVQAAEESPPNWPLGLSVSGVVCWTISAILLPGFMRRERTIVPGQMTLVIDGQGVTEVWPHQRVLQRWARFAQSFEVSDLLVLADRDGGGVILPKRLLTTDDASRLDRLLQQHLASPSQGIQYAKPDVQ